MDSKRIDVLLERYWNCVTTQEEEAELRAFFNAGEKIPAHLVSIAPLFQFFTKEAEVKLNDATFEEALFKRIKQRSVSKTNVRKFEQSFQNYMKVAAAIGLVIATSFVFRMEVWQGDKPQLLLVEDTYKNPEKAYEETKKALMLIASKMNKGKKEANKISMFSKAKSKIKKSN